MAVVESQIAETFVAVEQQVLVPAIRRVVRVGRAHLKSDDVVLGTLQFAARAERNDRFDGFLRFKFLEHLQVRIFRIQNGAALSAHHAERMSGGA